MSKGKFNYFRHSTGMRNDPRIKVLQNLMGRKSKEAYHYWCILLELCADISEDGQTEFTFHENTLRVAWETNAKGVQEVCRLLTLSALCVCTHHASHVRCDLVKLPKYLGSYDTKERKEKEKKEKKLLEKSPLAILFNPDDEIQGWLLTGTEAAQKDLLQKYSHHILAEEIKKAYLWQLEKSPRKAGTFLVTWMSNIKATAYGLSRSSLTKTKATPDNPTGNPYKAILSEMDKSGETA
jgi:hypothetical protein